MFPDTRTGRVTGRMDCYEGKCASSYFVNQTLNDSHVDMVHRPADLLSYVTFGQYYLVPVMFYMETSFVLLVFSHTCLANLANLPKSDLVIWKHGSSYADVKDQLGTLHAAYATLGVTQVGERNNTGGAGREGPGDSGGSEGGTGSGGQFLHCGTVMADAADHPLIWDSLSAPEPD